MEDSQRMPVFEAALSSGGLRQSSQKYQQEDSQREVEAGNDSSDPKKPVLPSPFSQAQSPRLHPSMQAHEIYSMAGQPPGGWIPSPCYQPHPGQEYAPRPSTAASSDSSGSRGNHLKGNSSPVSTKSSTPFVTGGSARHSYGYGENQRGSPPTPNTMFQLHASDGTYGHHVFTRQQPPGFTNVHHHPNAVYSAYPAATFSANASNQNGFFFPGAIQPQSVTSSNMWSIPPPQVPPPPVPLVYDIKPEDVLCGRGGATNSHSGNRAFRALVKKYQGGYLKAKKRDKPAVASVIVDLIRKKGGRFLRRYERTAPNGQVLWVDIGDDRAREKTCQALRENAPEIRKKKKKKRLRLQKSTRAGSASSTSSSSSESMSDADDIDEDQMREHQDTDDDEADRYPAMPTKGKPISWTSNSSASTAQTTNGRAVASPASRQRRHCVVSKWSTPSSPKTTRNNTETDTPGATPPKVKPSSLSLCSSSSASSAPLAECGPIMIRPMMKLLPKRLWRSNPAIPVDELESIDREIYCRDFLPPCPTSASAGCGGEPMLRADDDDGGNTTAEEGLDQNDGCVAQNPVAPSLLPLRKAQATIGVVDV